MFPQSCSCSCCSPPARTHSPLPITAYHTAALICTGNLIIIVSLQSTKRNVSPSMTGLIAKKMYVQCTNSLLAHDIFLLFKQTHSHCMHPMCFHLIIHIHIFEICMQLRLIKKLVLYLPLFSLNLLQDIVIHASLAVCL